MAVEWERDGKPCEVQLWDTAGQEALSQLRSVAYPDTDVFLLAYDMTRKDSLENIPTWLDEVQAECSDYDRIILVGTKYDLWCERKEAGEDADLVEVQEVEKIAEEIEASDTAFTSARTGYGFPNSDGLQYDGENEDEDEPDLRQLILGVESGESEESVEVLAAELETPEGTAAGEDAEAAAEDADVGAEDADAPAEDADAVGSREALELEIEEAAQQKDYKRAAELQEQLEQLDAETPAEDDIEGVAEELVAAELETLEATAEVEDRVIADSDLLELFKAADENQDGALDPAELTAALFFHPDLNLSPTAILDIVQAADVNNDGLIEFDEFVPVARKMMENPAEEAVAEYEPAVSGDKLDEYLQKQFKEYDANADGALQTMEYIRLMRDCEFHFPDKLIIEVCIVLLCE